MTEMRVSPRPLPVVLVDVVAVLGAASMAWTSSAAAMRGAAASSATILVAATLAAVSVGVGVRIASRRAGHRPGLFVIAALAPVGLVAVAAHLAHAVALASIPATITAVLCTILVATVRSARAHGSFDALERVGTVAGVSATSFSALALPFLGWLAAIPFAIGLGILSLVAVRELVRARWLARVHAGDEPGWSIVHESDLDTRENVPGATDHPLADAVLTFVAPSTDPYRAGRPHVVARVHAKPEALVRAPRMRAGKALLAIAIAGACASFGVVAAAKMNARDHHHHASRTAADLGAPECSSARLYFKDRLERQPNVAWATLVTHAEDVTIREGEGVLLILPRWGEIDSSEILAVANSIPCDRKLALRVERPAMRAFTVRAKLALDPMVERSTVRLEAERQLRELTDVRTASLAPHAGAGADDRTFGWRPRYVLRHLPGVVRASVTVDGVEDAPLGPRELPVIQAIELVDTETGDEL